MSETDANQSVPARPAAQPANAAAVGPLTDRSSDIHPELRAARQRDLLLKIVRTGFLILFLTVTALTLLDIDPDNSTKEAILGLGFQEGALLKAGVAVGVGGLVAVIDWLTPNKKISTLAAVFLGLLGSMLATYALGAVIDLLQKLYDINDEGLVATVKVLLGICLAYIGIITVLQTQDEFRLVIPYVEFAKERRGTRALVLDSSVLIDARVLGVARTGVLQAPLVIPRFVIDELQRLADSADELKRARGRRGLDVIGQLQREPGLDVTIDETPVDAIAVDRQLVELAKIVSGVVATTDTALERVAAISGVGSLNVNALAASLKPELVPGERVSIVIQRPGEQPGQGVGFLPDGTMVVVSSAGDRAGETVEVRVASSLQTSAGRLIFAELNNAAADAAAGVRDTAELTERENISASTTAEVVAGDRPSKPKRAGRDSPRNPRRG